MSVRKTTKKLAKFTWDINPYVIVGKKIHKAVTKDRRIENSEPMLTPAQPQAQVKLKYDKDLVAFKSSVVHEFSTTGKKHRINRYTS